VKGSGLLNKGTKRKKEEWYRLEGESMNKLGSGKRIEHIGFWDFMGLGVNT